MSNIEGKNNKRQIDIPCNNHNEEHEKQGISKCIIITGMSGGGKSTALKILEDIGFYAIDNIPPAILPQLIDMLKTHEAAVNNGIVAVIDVRGGILLKGFEDVITTLKSKVSLVKVIFLDAGDEILIRRYETTRRRHPLGKDLPLSVMISKERSVVAPVRELADVVIDTSNLSIQELKDALLKSLGMMDAEPSVIITSFGYKYGIPSDCDYVFDVRFLENPFYCPPLRNLTGVDVEVQEYLLNFTETEKFYNESLRLIKLILPLYRKTGKPQVHIGVGCTGGRHRSVAYSEWLAKVLSADGEKCIIRHRDIEKDKEKVSDVVAG